MSKTRRDGGKKVVKQELLSKYGKYCWLCMEKFDTKDLTLHHIIPYSISHTTTLKDSMILCQNCHFNIVNNLKYGTPEYDELMETAKRNINKRYHMPFNEEVEEPDE